MFVSKQSLKYLKLKKVIWAITKKNPLKKESNTNISERIKVSKKIIEKTNYIKIKFYENMIKSNKTIDLINYLSKSKKNEIYFLMGAYNLINLHKWYKCKTI